MNGCLCHCRRSCFCTSGLQLPAVTSVVSCILCLLLIAAVALEASNNTNDLRFQPLIQACCACLCCSSLSDIRRVLPRIHFVTACSLVSESEQAIITMTAVSTSATSFALVGLYCVWKNRRVSQSLVESAFATDTLALVLLCFPQLAASTSFLHLTLRSCGLKWHVEPDVNMCLPCFERKLAIAAQLYLH